MSWFDPPARSAVKEAAPEGLRRLVRKFDPVERDFVNRSLAKVGEEFVNLARLLLNIR